MNHDIVDPVGEKKSRWDFEAPVFASRWLLYPINVGLLVALVMYVVRFLTDTWHLIANGLILDTEPLMVLVLGLIDTAMVANLLVMIVQGSHQIFIRRLKINADNRPQWLDHIDSGIMKVKVALSIAGITLIRILKDFVDMEQIDWNVAVHRMWIHGMCLLSALAMAIIWRITHSSPKNH